MTEEQNLLGGNPFCTQSVMPPHDFVGTLYNFPEIFYPLFIGEPGRIEKYWAENYDLFESLNMPNLDTWLVWQLLSEPQRFFKALPKTHSIFPHVDQNGMRMHRLSYHFVSTAMVRMRSNTSKS